MPYPPLDGGAQLINNTTHGLIECGIDLTLLAINTPKNPVDLNSIPHSYKSKTKLIVADVDTRIKFLPAFFNFFKKQSYFIERFYSKHFEDILKNLLSKEKFEVIQLEHLYLCVYLDTLRKYSSAKIIFRPQNIEFVIWELYLKTQHNFFKKVFIDTATKRLKRFEKNIAGKLDGIIAVTENDASAFRSFAPEVNVTTIPMGFDFSLTKHYDYEKQYEDFPQFYHLGSMDWLPNEQAVDWFMKNVFQKLVNKFPGIKVYLAGKSMQQKFYNRASGNLIVDGQINDPLKYQENKSVMIVPLLSGSGIRAKIVEGMSLGKTIISTTIGATGIDYENNKNILIADTPDEFIFQVEKCFDKNSCRMIGNNAKEMALKKFHYIGCAGKMIEYYKTITHLHPAQKLFPEDMLHQE